MQLTVPRGRILVVMVTGDHPATAEAIAKSGIIKTSGGATCDDQKTMNKRMYGVLSQFYMSGMTLTSEEKRTMSGGESLSRLLSSKLRFPKIKQCWPHGVRYSSLE